MKRTSLLITFCVVTVLNLNAQNKQSSTDRLLAEISENACKCVDSIYVGTRSSAEVSKAIHDCIDKQAMAYQLGAKLLSIDLSKTPDNAAGKDSTQSINNKNVITLNSNKDSKDYQDAYYEIERFMMDSCAAMKFKIAVNDKHSDKSYTAIPRAMDLYNKGIDLSKNENYKDALPYFEQAVKVDPKFAFAWDNIGVCYRKLDNYDKAIEAYNKSLEIDPNGTMPLQNIAVAYQYKKQYRKAVSAYERLAKIEKNNPEIFYGIGQVYALYLDEPEKGLDYMCKAYNLYIAQKSPYRSDAEKIMSMIYSDMKKLYKEDRFWEILKQNNIAFDDKE